MKCKICGAEAQLTDGFELCDEHKAMAGIVDMILEDREFLDAIKLPRMKWMEESS